MAESPYSSSLTSPTSNKASITTTIELPGQSTSVYETSVSIPPGERIHPAGLVSLITGHISVLDEELNVLKGSK